MAQAKQLSLLAYFFQSYRWRCVLVISLMFLSGLMEMLNLAALYPIINYGLHLDNNGQVIKFFDWVIRFIKPDQPFFSACVVLIALSLASAAVRFMYTYVSNRLLIDIIGYVQKGLLKRLIQADYDFYVKHQQGQLLYASTTATERTTAAFFTTMTLIYQSINALILFSFLLILTWQATLAVMILGAIYTLVIRGVMKRVTYQSAKVNVGENQRRNIILNEFISGVKTIKVFKADMAWRERYHEAVERGLSSQFKMLMGSVFPELSVKCLFYISLAIAGISMSHHSQAQIMTMLPVFGTFVVVVNRFLPSAQVIGGSIIKLTEYLPDIKIVYDLFNTPQSRLPLGHLTAKPFANEIVFDRVTFAYDGQAPVLKDLSFRIKHQQMTALVGLSGSGKTTIINLLLRLYQPQSGQIFMDGVNIHDIAIDPYLAQIGYVSQDSFIFNNSFKENIRFGLNQATDEMIEEAAKLAHAHDFIVNTPHGYDTVVGDAGIKLSGGQKQRIAIARAMLRKPAMIILDEATSSLDNISEKKIQMAMDTIAKHTTVLVIAHRLSTVEHADNIIILSQGQIQEQGTHQVLMQNKQLYFALHQVKDLKPQEESARETEA